MGPRASQDLRSPFPIMAPVINQSKLHFAVAQNKVYKRNMWEKADR